MKANVIFCSVLQMMAFLSLTPFLADAGELGKMRPVNAVVAISEPQVRLKVLSWNIGMLPLMDLFRSDPERAEGIARALSMNDYDILVLEEVFSHQARSILSAALKHRYPFAYGPFNRTGLTFRFSSGLWVLSKVPLKVLKEIEFTASAGFDSFARKGAVLLEGEVGGQVFQIIATHLQDDIYPQSIRDNQLAEIFRHLVEPYSIESIPQIICGDFNTDKSHEVNYRSMLSSLDAADGDLSGQTRVSFDDVLNDYSRTPNPNPRLIDFILTRNTEAVKRVERKVAVIKGNWGGGREYLSDHHGIEAVFHFRNPSLLSKLIAGQGK
jgi:endonuclease/exonuclease/phosphatase family metal-dependent hydrolase